MAIRLPQGVQRFVLKEFVRQTEAYFHRPDLEGWEVEQLTDRVCTFRWGWYRNIFVVTDEAVFATDPFNTKAAALLAQGFATRRATDLSNCSTPTTTAIMSRVAQRWVLVPLSATNSAPITLQITRPPRWT